MKYLLFVTVILTCGFLQAQDGDSLFDDEFLHEIRFEQMDTITYINTKEYQQVRVFIDGNVVDSVGVKRKGNISGYNETNKFPLKIKANKYVQGREYDGIKEFTLHMNYQDPSMLREKLTYDLCDEIGLFSLRSAFTRVYFNDIYWGLFTIVEGKDEMYKQVFDNRQMDAVESLDFGDLCYYTDDPADYFDSYFPRYQLENGNGATAFPSFVSLLDVANNTIPGEYEKLVELQFNIKDFVRYQALNVYLMNFDSYLRFRGNQIYVFDEDLQIWQVTPWDFNASFGMWDTNNAQADTYELFPNEVTNNCVIQRMNDVSGLRNHYLQSMCELRAILGDTTSYFAKIDEYKSQINQAVLEDNRNVLSYEGFEKSIGYGTQLIFGENQPSLKGFLSDRFDVINEGLIAEGFVCSPVGVEEEDTENSYRIIPNPARNYVQLMKGRNTLDDTEVLVYDVRGKLVLETKSNGGYIDVSDFSAGIYSMSFSVDGRRIALRFLVK